MQSVDVKVEDTEPGENDAYEGMNFCQKAFQFCRVNNGLGNSKIKEIIDENESNRHKNENAIKILVLGPGDSGKSTILKQMRIIHGKNYNETERKKFKPCIVKNLIDSIVNLINAMSLFSLHFENAENVDHAESIFECQQKLAFDIHDWDRNSLNYSSFIKSIWNDPSIKVCLARRNMFQLNDSIEYFILHLNRISSAQYVPEIDDILRARQPTTAIQEYKYKISSSYFLFVDVGGQRSERRKWINCFENVTSLLYVASLSDYDLFLSSNELKSSNCDSTQVNRMKESIALFKTLINWKKTVYVSTSNGDAPRKIAKHSLLFDRVSIILFLNKEDLFEQKFRHSSIRVCFPDYRETDSAERAKEFIANKFIECDENETNGSDESKRSIYWHYTYALDRNNIETVVASVKDRILKYMIESMRL